MNTTPPATLRALATFVGILAAVVTPRSPAADNLPAVAKANVRAPVTVTDSGAAWTMDNGIVRATIDKGSGQHDVAGVITASTPWAGADIGNKPVRPG